MKRLFSGYSMIELLVVLAVLGILASAVWPLAELSVRREREKVLERALWQIRTAIDEYKQLSDAGEIKRLTESGYPPDLAVLVKGVPDVKTGRTHYFLRRLPQDPFVDKSLSPEVSWGVRAYESPPETPSKGSDVYDVYSRSSQTGLNGVPISKW